MTNSILQDASAVAPVQDSPLCSTNPRSLFSDTLDALDAALEAGHVGALQVLAPGLTKAGARSVLYHHQQQAWRLQMGSRDYGAKTWGAAPPLRLLQGTLALRMAVLRVWHPEMSEADVRRVVIINMGDELARGEFWRLPITTLNVSDERTARSLLHGRRFAVLQEMLAYCRADLERIHAATVEMLSEAGLSWDLLASHAAGTHAKAGAIEQQAEAEANDLQAFGAYLPEALRAA